MRTKIETAVLTLLFLVRKGHSLILLKSGGKDSCVITLLGLEALRRAKIEGIPLSKHYVSSAETTIDNPAISNHLAIMHSEIEDFCAREALSVEVRIAKPALAKQFVVQTIGRGTLVRTPENSVKDGEKKRPCADDWKVQPQTKLAKELRDEVLAQGLLEPIACLGTRRDESASRAGAMLDRDEQSATPTRNKNGHLTISPIADWSTDDVWECLGMFMNPAEAPFPSFTDGQSIIRMLDIYRDGNEGTCGVVLGESGNRSSCGSRFGCTFCLISGERDKSLESMIREPRHAHLTGLSRFRTYLSRTQWDISKRELVGRTLSKAGYLRVKPDTYSMSHRLDLLRMLLTLDVLEQERAQEHAEDLRTGLIPDTPDNRELANIQFQMITPEQLVAIDFQLSLHHYAPHAFPAVQVWHEVYELGRRYSIPDVPPVQKIAIKSHGWFKVGEYDFEVPTDGLRSYEDEMWNKYRHPDRPATHRFTSRGEQVTWFDETKGLTVDALEANLFLTCIYDLEFMLDSQSHPAIESARFWLNEGIVRLAHGTSWKYQEMAKRGQYFAHMVNKLNVTPAELDVYLAGHTISESEHTVLLEVMGEAAPVEADDVQIELADSQYDLFDLFPIAA